ncbi:hypothetical protein [uncultured Paludibaculum sp.]|uniref:hypothetical protein n=1 Tax=uncultured Paludibaculum sp. TaxID=1765020 RepID=UPI00374D0FDE
MSILPQADATLLTELLLSGLAIAFDVVALFLASVGSCGVLSYRIGQRHHSIGIRMAWGTSPVSVTTGVLRKSELVMAAGMLGGLPLAIVAARAEDSLLWGVRPDDPAIYLVGAHALCLAGFMSVWLPEGRASAIAPPGALQHS